MTKSLTMQNNLKVAIIQSHLYWENPLQNRIHFENQINTLKETIDIIVLPELFTTGFTMQPKLVAETMEGDTIKWLKNIATTKKAVITGSICIKENNAYYNRLVVVHPNKQIDYYDKRHTFTLAGENKVYTAGKKQLLVTYKGWKICPLICYDLRFPVWSRNTTDYDLLIYVANWPKVRITAWNTLLKARAIENMSYCIGVNRVGLDAYNYEYNGHSAVYNSLGAPLKKLVNTQATAIVTLNKPQQEQQRQKLQFLNDRDDFTLY